MAEVTDNGPGWVKMYHPDTDPGESGTHEITEVTAEAFTEVWEPKGWKLVEGEALPLSDEQIATASKRELIAEAERRGLPTDGTADELRTALTSQGG